MKMKKRELFVFAGQSNMMGAGVYPPRQNIEVNNSFEYLQKTDRFLLTFRNLQI